MICMLILIIFSPESYPHLEFTSKLMVTWNPSDFEGKPYKDIEW